MNRKTKLIIAIISSVALAISTFIVIYFTVISPRGLTEFDNIVIWNDSDFRDYNFEGKGTADEPYLISNYKITTSIARGIYIADTTKHFIIEGCIIEAPYAGIYIRNTAEGTVTISNSSIKSGKVGIYVSNSDDIRIINNTCENIHGENGISLYHSSGALVVNNTCESVSGLNSLESNFGNGIAILNCPDSLIANNQIAHNDGHGISVETSPNSIFERNLIVENAITGLFLWNSENCSIKSNDFIGAGLVFEVWNRYTDELDQGNSLEYYKSFKVENNFVNEKPLGYYVDYENLIISTESNEQYIFINCTNLTVSSQELWNTTGLTFYYCRNLMVLENIINFSAESGISLYYCDYTTLDNNICTYNKMRGAIAYASNNSIFINNTFSYNAQRGLVTQFSYNNTATLNQCNFNMNVGISGGQDLQINIIKNNCSNNGIAGIEIGRSLNVTISNNTLTGSKFGLTTGAPRFFNISFNEISNNNIGIQFAGKAEFGFSENCTIYRNLISDNLNYGIVIYNGKFNSIHHNSFINNNQGTIQAFDSGFSNLWYDSITEKGNFWSDFSGIGTYTIAGPALAEDLYPLLTPPV